MSDRPRRLGATTALVLSAGLASALTAAPLFLGANREGFVVLHVAVATSFFAGLGVKLALLGARARLPRARGSWELLIAHGGSVLGAYTLLTGGLVMLDPAWSDQHLAASFWFGVVVTVHGRQYATRLRALLSSKPDTDLRRLPAAAWRLPVPHSGHRLVVVGGGMAGHALVEELVRRGDRRITLVAEEDVEPYDRTRLSELLRDPAAERLARRPRSWYAESGVELRLAAPATALDLSRQRLIDRTGAEHGYDALVIATGSRAFVPPIVGTELAHVFPYRTRRDAEAIAHGARRARTAVVVGGGLLGLEAAGALRELRVAVTVVEAAKRLMPQQLDAGGAALLARSLARLGVETHVASSVAAIRPTSVELAGGRTLPADLVVVAAGVRAETSLARDAGLEVRRGVVVDDEMRASARDVWAVGECAEHRGVVQGLWPPVLRQVRAAVASLSGAPVSFEAAPAQATLKVAGIDLFVVGRTASRAGDEEVLRSDGRSGAYAKLVVDGERLAGAMLLGDTARAPALRHLVATGAPVPVDVLDAPASEPDRALICRCMHVTPERIRRAVEDEGAGDLEAVSALTGAGTGCGSCAGAVSRVVAECHGMAAVD